MGEVPLDDLANTYWCCYKQEVQQLGTDERRRPFEVLVQIQVRMMTVPKHGLAPVPVPAPAPAPVPELELEPEPVEQIEPEPELLVRAVCLGPQPAAVAVYQEQVIG